MSDPTTNQTTPSSIDIMDGILRPLLGSMQATSTAVAIWRALRNAGLLNEELLPETEALQ